MNEKELREKKNALLEKADDVLNKAKMEKRELTDAEAQELAEIRDNVRRIVHHLDLVDDLERLDDKKPKEEPKAGGNEEVKTEEEIKKETELQETRAFENFIRGKIVHERANNLTPANGSGEALIPTTIANRIIKKVYDISPILERSQKYNVKGNLEIPYYDNSTTSITMAYATEFQELSSNVGAFTNIQLGGFLAGALTLVSRSLINNSQFDIVGFVVDEMAFAIKRFLEGELLNGTPSKVTGLSTATNILTTASATEITSDEVIQLKDSIKDDFQNNAIWIMSPSTRTALRLLKDDVGRYLLQDDITSPFGTTLLGKPIYVSDNMADIATGENVIYYGDMRCLATKFSEEMNIEVLREKYATQHAVGVVGWVEFDSKIQDQQGIAVMQMA